MPIFLAMTILGELQSSSQIYLISHAWPFCNMLFVVAVVGGFSPSPTNLIIVVGSLHLSFCFIAEKFVTYGSSLNWLHITVKGS